MVADVFHTFVAFLRKYWRPVLLLLLGMLVPLLFVMDITEDVFRDGGFAWDASVLHWWRVRRTPELTDLASVLAVLGGLAVLPLLTLGISWALARAGHRLYAWFLPVAVFGSLALNVGAKLIFKRPRPDEIGAVLVERGYSFPSGHAMTNAAFGLALLFICWPHPRLRLLGVLGLLWGVLIGLSRNYLGVHYPTDVLVGFLSALIWVSGLRLVLRGAWPHPVRVQADAVPEPQPTK